MNIERLKTRVVYNPKTGLFTDLKGVAIGHDFKLKGKGTAYTTIVVDGKSYRAHRLAFIYMTGSAPGIIDHINGDGTDNRWLNLRGVNHSESAKNMPLRKDSTSGIPGVNKYKGDWGWRALITDLEGNRLHLYQGKDFFEACCRRKSAERECGYHQNHGRHSHHQ